MKFKVFSVLLVFVLCFTLFTFTNISSAETNNDKDPLASLIEKIEEIKSVLNMNLKLEENLLKARMKGFFQKYKTSLPNEFSFKDHDGNAISDLDDIAQYLFDHREQISNIRLKKFDYEEVEIDPTADDYTIDAKAKVHLKFDVASSGEILLGLRHMRRCIWD